MATMAKRKYLCYTCNLDLGSAAASRKHFDENPSHMNDAQRENRRRNGEMKRKRDLRANQVRGRDPVEMDDIEGARVWTVGRCKCHCCHVSFTDAKLAGAHFAKYPDHRNERQQDFYDKDQVRSKAYRTRKTRQSSARRKTKAKVVTTPPPNNARMAAGATPSVYICPTCGVDCRCAAQLAKHYIAEPGHVTEKTMKSRNRNKRRGPWRQEAETVVADRFKTPEEIPSVVDVPISASEPMEVAGLVPDKVLEVELTEDGIRVGGQVFPLVTGQRYTCNFCPHCGFSLEAIHDAVDPELVSALPI